MKIWLALILLVPTLAWAQAEEQQKLPTPESSDGAPTEPGEEPVNWVDTSHAAAADSAQVLVEWMDDFLGDASNDTEKAESYLRLEFENEWDEHFGNDFGVRLRGKIQLPKTNKRVDLLFTDDDTEVADRESRRDEDTVSLQLKVRESERSRFDATMGFSSSHLKPGVRYRNEGAFSDTRSYRYIQRLQYEDGENFFTLGQVDLYQVLASQKVLRWNNRIKYGDHTNGIEWRTRLSLFHRFNEDSNRPVAINYFGLIRGQTQRESFTKLYKIGATWRRQVYRDFLFFEVEPSMNYRRQKYEDERDLAWGLVLRMEIHLSRDFTRKKREN